MKELFSALKERLVLALLYAMGFALMINSTACMGTNKALVSMSRQDVVGPVLATKTTTTTTKNADGSTTSVTTTESTNMSSAAADLDLKKHVSTITGTVGVAEAKAEGKKNANTARCNPYMGCVAGPQYGNYGTMPIGSWNPNFPPPMIDNRSDGRNKLSCNPRC